MSLLVLFSHVLCQVFRDLEFLRENNLVKSSTLHIKSEVLGKGGFGFVCKGELMQERDNVCVEVSTAATNSLSLTSYSLSCLEEACSCEGIS